MHNINYFIFKFLKFRQKMIYKLVIFLINDNCNKVNSSKKIKKKFQKKKKKKFNRDYIKVKKAYLGIFN
jgi:hypothetical protein